MESIRRIKVDESKVRMAVDSRVPLTVITYTLPHEMEDFMADLLKAFLTDLGSPASADALSYCLKELTNNAKKANTKRIYFEEKNLCITDPADYEHGMKDFKQETITNIDHYLEQQKNKGLYIKLILHAAENELIIEVRHNVELTVFEYKRIHDKVTRAQVYRSVEEGVMELLDDTEGAGLGIAIMILLLRRAGLSEENYRVISEGGETITRLSLPYSSLDRKDALKFKDAALALAGNVPVRRETIAEVSRILSNPFGRLGDLASVISSDVGFTCNLLRRVNAEPEYIAYPCATIADAIKSVGRKGLWAILFDISAEEKLVNVPQSQEALWAHSQRVALYAYNLAANFCSQKIKGPALDEVYLAGLLHDVAKIMFGCMAEDDVAKFDESCSKYNLDGEKVRGKYAGFYHAELGGMLAEKWNFSPAVVNALRYHHSPQSAPKEYTAVASLVCLADLLVHYRMHDIFFEQIDPWVMEQFGLKSERHVKEICFAMENAGGYLGPSFAGIQPMTAIRYQMQRPR